MIYHHDKSPGLFGWEILREAGPGIVHFPDPSLSSMAVNLGPICCFSQVVSTQQGVRESEEPSYEPCP